MGSFKGTRIVFVGERHVVPSCLVLVFFFLTKEHRSKEKQKNKKRENLKANIVEQTELLNPKRPIHASKEK